MRGSPFFFLALPVQKDGADVRSDLAREDRDRVVEVGQHPLDRRFPLGDDLVGAIEFEQPDGSESWRDVNVVRLAGESGPRDAVLNDAEGRDHYAEHGGGSRIAPEEAPGERRSEEQTSELQSLMRLSY